MLTLQTSLESVGQTGRGLWLSQHLGSARPALLTPPPSHAAPYRLAVDIAQHGGGVDLVEAGEKVQHFSTAGGVAHAIC